jgi:endogenous inhibitor of DNA gyrase (YacG/DUF329 family)
MLKALKSLGQAVGQAVFSREGLRGIVADYRARKRQAAFDQKLRNEIAASKCWTCAAPVGEQPLRDPDFSGRYYCSLDCRTTALIRRDSELDEKMARQPARLTADEQALLAGQSSPGMHYEPGRCVLCGHGLDDSRAVFSFCSARCEQRAMQPYVTLTGRLEDSDEHKKAVKDRDDFARKEPDIVDEVKQRCGKTTMTDGEIAEYLDQQIKFAELLHDRRKRFDDAEARVRFLKKWELQRGYVLEDEKRKEIRRPQNR